MTAVNRTSIRKTMRTWLDDYEAPQQEFLTCKCGQLFMAIYGGSAYPSVSKKDAQRTLKSLERTHKREGRCTN